MLTELAKGKSIEEAKKISNKDVAKALEGLPKNKLHCSNLGADALHMAIQDYEARKTGKPKEEREEDESDKHSHDEKCYCPYCDSQISDEETVCKNCALNVDDQQESQQAGGE
jgi:nitrogen fixation NifU-like protein